jgi:hypothetical protein
MPAAVSTASDCAFAWIDFRDSNTRYLRRTEHAAQRFGRVYLRTVRRLLSWCWCPIVELLKGFTVPKGSKAALRRPERVKWK